MASALDDWRGNDATVQELCAFVRQYFDDGAAPDSAAWQAAIVLWRRFEGEAAWIDGMTMNERLFVFDLEERFERAWPFSAESHRVRVKVHAAP